MRLITLGKILENCVKKLFFLFVLMVSASFAWANEADKSSLITQLNHVKLFSSEFNQDVLDESGRVLQHSSGKMQFVRPALFYWNVTSPNPQTIWYRNKTLIVFDPELMQATIKKIQAKNDPSMLPVMLLTGDAALALKEFNVGFYKQKYVLTPKSKEGERLLIRLVLELNSSNGAIQEIQYQTVLGQMTKITFSDVSVNHALDQTLFSQQLPSGTDKVDVS